MKKITFFLITCILSFATMAQAPDFAWAKKLETLSIPLLATDTVGNIYICGSYDGGGTTIGSITLPAPSVGGNQFIAKLNPSGTPIWAIHMRGIYTQGMEENFQKLLVDDAGNIYLSSFCVTSGAGSSINGVPISVPGSGPSANFLAKLDAFGNLQWIRTAGFPENYYSNVPTTIQFDQSGNICMMGIFSTTIAFDSAHVLTNTGSATGADGFAVTYDTNGNVLRAVELGVIQPFNISQFETFRLDKHDHIYRLVQNIRQIVKYDALGNVLMTKTLVSSGAVLGLSSMYIDLNENIFLSSWFYNGSLTIEGTLVPKFGTSTNTDALLIKLDPSGNLQWLRQFQATVSDAYTQVYADAIGNVYALGQHSDAAQRRSLITKYSNSGTLLWQQVITPGPGAPGAPGGFATALNMAGTNNGGNIIVSGNFKERLYFDAGTSFTGPAGVAKAFYAKYGICNTPRPVISSIATSFCAGDSLLLASTAANDYVWSTGDTSNTIYATATGDYSVIAIEDAECYAHSIPVHISEAAFPSTAVTQSGTALTAAESGATYQWINCADNTPIAGEAAQIFIATANGNYALIISNSNGCTDTSVCYAIVETGMHEASQNIISIYPNPVRDGLTIVTSASLRSVTILNQLGQQVMTGQTKQLNVSSLAEGIYFVVVETAEGIFRGKLIKE